MGYSKNMNREKIINKIKHLEKMTIENGCTYNEQLTAESIKQKLIEKYLKEDEKEQEIGQKREQTLNIKKENIFNFSCDLNKLFWKIYYYVIIPTIFFYNLLN